MFNSEDMTYIEVQEPPMLSVPTDPPSIRRSDIRYLLRQMLPDSFNNEWRLEFVKRKRQRPLKSKHAASKKPRPFISQEEKSLMDNSPLTDQDKEQIRKFYKRPRSPSPDLC